MARLDPDLRSLQEVRDLVERASEAQKIAARWTQAEADAVCEEMSRAGAAAAHDLARLAVDETGIGRVHYKVLKNLLGAEGTWASIKDTKTVGILKRDEQRGVIEVGTPAGVIAVIVPTTNPTSTVINNAMIALKGRNAVVISPHPRAKRCIAETAEILRRAVERAGGPADLICAITSPTIDATAALMRHKKISMILATGGSGLVREAYSSGKPAYGVGPGNVPAYIDRTANIEQAAKWVVASQSFDNGTLCCSEQALVLDRPIADDMLAKLQKRGAHLCCPEEVEKLSRHCVKNGMMSADVVGQDPWKVAEGAGFRVPRSTTVLLVPQEGVGREFPLSGEVLCPLLSVHMVDGWEQGCEVSLSILRFGGMGHTIGVWATDERVLEAWFLEKPASRIVVNGPTSQGAVGYSTNLMPAMSLGCGPHAGNITSDNITATHLINVKRVAFQRADWDATYVRDLERAARFTGDPAPRGSGLPGDPGLSGTDGPRAAEPTAAGHPATSKAPEVESTWRGNPPVTLPTSRTGSTTRPATAPTSSSAPRFTQPAGAGSSRSTQRATPEVKPAPARQAATRPSLTGSAGASGPGPYVGSSLTQEEIKGILEHAGAGCPLGPCQGCPHQDTKTGACTA